MMMLMMIVMMILPTQSWKVSLSMVGKLPLTTLLLCRITLSTWALVRGDTAAVVVVDVVVVDVVDVVVVVVVVVAVVVVVEVVVVPDVTVKKKLSGCFQN